MGYPDGMVQVSTHSLLNFDVGDELRFLVQHPVGESAPRVTLRGGTTTCVALQCLGPKREDVDYTGG